VPNFSKAKPASWVERPHDLKTWDSFRTATGRSMYPGSTALYTSLSNQYWLGYAPSRFPNRNGNNSKSLYSQECLLIFSEIMASHLIKTGSKTHDSAHFVSFTDLIFQNRHFKSFFTNTADCCTQNKVGKSFCHGKFYFQHSSSYTNSACLFPAFFSPSGNTAPAECHSDARRRSAQSDLTGDGAKS
jgi:hypothetical protein